MKNDIVELVAKEIYRNSDNVTQYNWDGMTESGREAVRKQARAALAVVPSFAMKSASDGQIFLRVNQWTTHAKATKILEILVAQE